MRIENLEILPRDKNPLYQVRFWTKPELYEKFTAHLEEQGILIQDAFNQFMEWVVVNKPK